MAYPLRGFPGEIGAGKVVDHRNAEWSLAEIEQIELWTAEFRYNGGKAFYERSLSYRNTREKRPLSLIRIMSPNSTPVRISHPVTSCGGGSSRNRFPS
jgi:hypothetical protein